MVLEHIFPAHWYEKKFTYSFFIGFAFSLISVFIASKVFGANSGIVSVMFLTLFILPSIRKVFSEEEMLEEHEKRFSFRHLYNDNKQALRTYFGVFFGIFSAYMFITFILPQIGITPVQLLREQLFLDPAVSGRATFSLGLFTSILSNNWIVLLVAFIFAIIWNDGALFFVAWNASAWGAIFGYRALTASLMMPAASGFEAFTNSVQTLLIQESITIWHTTLEGGAYILAAIAGSIISAEVVKKSSEMRSFLLHAVFAIIGYYLLRFLVWPLGYGLPRTLIMIIGTLGLVYTLSYAFKHRKHREVFTYNYWLLVVAVLIFIVGVLVETIVLGSSGTLQRIYAQSAAFTPL